MILEIVQCSRQGVHNLYHKQSVMDMLVIYIARWGNLAHKEIYVVI